MLSTLVLIMTFNGNGFQPANVQAVAMPSAQCQAMAAHPPQRRNWTTVAFCTNGGDLALNLKAK